MKKHSNKWIYIYLGAYFVLGLLMLDKFPFMHSDESWLSGLSRAMMSGGAGVTEPFFDLLPRFPHAIKILFHSMQMPFIAVFGYGLFAVRLVSLVFGTALLFVFYRLCVKLFGGESDEPRRDLDVPEIKALVMTAVLSLDVQFIYASHMARQDIVIAFGIVLVMYFVIGNADKWNYKKDIVVGVMVGLMVGVHPNSLMVALAAGALYLYYIFAKKLKVRNLLVLVGVVAAIAGVFVGISYTFDAQFLTHYFKYGSTLGVDMSLWQKVQYLPGYFVKLFAGVSGTYYTPPVQMQLVLFGVSVVVSVVVAFFKRDVLKVLLPILAVVVGIVVIGRYSQPAVILLFPLLWLLVFYLVEKLPKVVSTVAYSVLGAAVLTMSLIAILPYINRDYDEYIERIEEAVPSDAMVLANLNAQYSFDEGKLLDVRNLEFLEEAGLTFGEYVESRDIEYIVYSQEMDFIAEKRPTWNIVYGNVIPYYDDMKAFLARECSVVDSFTSPYAMRIVQYANEREWTVTIYRVENQE